LNNLTIPHSQFAGGTSPDAKSLSFVLLFEGEGLGWVLFLAFSSGEGEPLAVDEEIIFKLYKKCSPHPSRISRDTFSKEEGFLPRWGRLGLVRSVFLYLPTTHL